MDQYEKAMDLDNDPRYGNISIYFNRTNPNQKAFKVTRKFANEADLEQEIKLLEDRIDSNDSCLLPIIDFQAFNKELEIDIFFEYMENSLNFEKLTDIELLYLFSDVLEGLYQLKKFKKFHGDITPNFVTFDINRRFYLIDKINYLESPVKTQVNAIESYKSLYMSPKIFESILNA